MIVKEVKNAVSVCAIKNICLFLVIKPLTVLFNMLTFLDKEVAVHALP